MEDEKTGNRKYEMPISVIIADDHYLVRKDITLLLRRHPNIIITGEFENTSDAIESIEITDPDIILLDTTLPDMQGADAIYHLLEKKRDLKIIILAMQDPDAVAAIRKLMKNGASGYIFKDAEISEIIEAIETVYEGGIYDSKKVSEEKLKTGKSISKNSQDDKSLTGKEIEILICVVNGMTSKEISEILSLSVRTVETHRRNIKRKLNLNTRAGLRGYAIDEGLIA